MSTYNKGDLILASGDEQTSTCIILTEKFMVSPEKNSSFYYTYCIETGLYGIVYEYEITALVAAGFAPEFKFHSEIFDTDYETYRELHSQFAYLPTFFPDSLFDIDSEDDSFE